MCGIVALYSPDRPVSLEAVRRATHALQHRGPDGEKVWVSDRENVALGHARLSVIDLKTGQQPIASQDQQTHIIVNGEFYGYESIQRELEKSGHRLRTRSDSEIALHLYRELGPQCLHRLRGEFAMVIWDERNRTLFAARDRFGIKPLFYAVHQGILYLASEVKALLAAGVPARWDADTVIHGSELSYPEMRTLFAGVLQIPPGHYLLATAGHQQLVKYWDFNYPSVTTDRPQKADAEYAAEVRAALDEAVRLRLRADVPVACYLSGGLDSCAILGLTAKHHARSIDAFTLCFDHPDYDERIPARQMAQQAGAKFHPVTIRQADLAAHFCDAVAYSETICVNAHFVAKYLLSRAVRDAGYKVVLTGEGSDEIFGGYAHFRRDMVLYNTQGQDPHTAARLLEELNSSNSVSRGLLLPDADTQTPAMAGIERLLGFVPSWMETTTVVAAKFGTLLADDYRGQHNGREPFRALLEGLDVKGQLVGREPVHQSAYLWSKAVLPRYLLTALADRMEMAHSIEGRVPFLDHHLVEGVKSMPVSQKIRGMTEKYVLREAVRDVIPEAIYCRQKHPFLSPPASSGPKDELASLVQDTLRGPRLASVPFFDRRKVIATLDQLAATDDRERVAFDPVLMAVLSVCVLQERFGLTA